MRRDTHVPAVGLAAVHDDELRLEDAGVGGARVAWPLRGGGDACGGREKRGEEVELHRDC